MHPFKNIHRLAQTTLMGGLLLLLAPCANAEIILSNLDGAPNSAGTNIAANNGDYRGKGVAFTIGEDNLQLESVTLSLKFANLLVAPSISLYSSSSSTTSAVPVAELLTFTNPAFSTGSTFNDYVFTPATSFTLLADTTYWLAVQATGNAPDTTMQWAYSNPSVTPTSVGGLATHLTQKYNASTTSELDPTKWTTSSGVTNTYAISITAIPEPSTYAIAAGAFVLGAALLRRRRA